MNRNPKALEGILEFCDQLRAITEDKAGRASGSSPALAGDHLRDLRGKALEALPAFSGRGNTEELGVLELLVLAFLFHRRTQGSMDCLYGGEIIAMAHSAGFPRTRILEALGTTATLRKNGWLLVDGNPRGGDPLETPFFADPRGLSLFLDSSSPSPSGADAQPYANEEEFLWDLYRWRNLCLQRAEALFEFSPGGTDPSERAAQADKASRNAWVLSRKRLGLTPGGRGFAIERFRKEHKLGEDDLLVVLHLLFSELIEVEPFLPALECLRVATSTRGELLRRRHSLSEGSPLRRSGIVMVRDPDYGKDRAVHFGLSDWAADQILAGIAAPPRLHQGELDEFLSGDA